MKNDHYFIASEKNPRRKKIRVVFLWIFTDNIFVKRFLQLYIYHSVPLRFARFYRLLPLFDPVRNRPLYLVANAKVPLYNAT